MAGKRKPAPEDSKLFRDSVRGVKRLRHERVPPYRRHTAPVPRKTLEDEEQVREEMLSLDYDPLEIEIGDELFFARPGLQHGTLRRLRRGQFAVQSELDMHGMTVAVARPALARFLAACQAADARCVRIVHGKGNNSPQGRAVLKTRLNGWLQQHDAVLAFCSAPPALGGTGVVLVLLKRYR